MSDTPRGSFGAPKQVVEDQIREQRAAEDLETQTKEVAKERVEQRKKERDAKIESKLPPKVQSGILGNVKYETFKRHYQDVWDQVNSKDHLLTQRVELEATLGSIPVKIQSLKRREEKALVTLEPTPVGFQVRMKGEDGKDERIEQTPQGMAEQRMEHMTYRLVVQLVTLGPANFPDLKLTPDNRKEWLEDTAVQDGFNYLLDIDPTMFNYLVSLVEDLDNAKYFALVENMKDPLELRSPTTESEPS